MKHETIDITQQTLDGDQAAAELISAYHQNAVAGKEDVYATKILFEMAQMRDSGHTLDGWSRIAGFAMQAHQVVTQNLADLNNELETETD